MMLPCCWEGSSGGLDREWARCRQRRDQDGSAPKALRLVIAALAGLLGGREERVQIAARPVQPKTVALQGETNGQTARSPTFMPEDPEMAPPAPVRSWQFLGNTDGTGDLAVVLPVCPATRQIRILRYRLDLSMIAEDS